VVRLETHSVGYTQSCPVPAVRGKLSGRSTAVASRFLQPESIPGVNPRPSLLSSSTNALSFPYKCEKSVRKVHTSLLVSAFSISTSFVQSVPPYDLILSAASAI
jgi:hypothetical protein